ncbi:hypothetical protein LP416_21620 [Polaromonas sp. P2-4]|nr:hypothetical protein LP416_21620 [Polaromonas sp. P2-4]
MHSRCTAKATAKPAGECAVHGKSEQLHDVADRTLAPPKIAHGQAGADLVEDAGEGRALAHEPAVNRAPIDTELACDLVGAAVSRGQQREHESPDLAGHHLVHLRELRFHVLARIPCHRRVGGRGTASRSFDAQTMPLKCMRSINHVSCAGGPDVRGMTRLLGVFCAVREYQEALDKDALTERPLTA